MGLDGKQATSFRTEPLTLMNHAGKRIRAYIDVPSGNADYAGMILVAPAYGETKENSLLISAHFVANGYCGVRFDWTDHVGESEGDVFCSTLTRMRDDLNVLLGHIQRVYHGHKIGIVATSLAARVALKIAADDTALDFLICFAPVVDLQGTLTMVYREDLVASFRKGKRYGTLNILGLSIDADGFLSDCIDQNFADICSTQCDARRIKTPVFFVLGQRDSWVRMTDAQTVLAAINSPTKKSCVLPKMLHRLHENPIVARDALQQAVHFVLNATTTGGHEIAEVNSPDTAEVEKRANHEKEHLKDLYVYSKIEERHFWKDYLSNFQYIINVHDFYNLLEFMYTQLGGASPGQKILDAGCGIGNYGLFLLTKQLYRSRQDLAYLRMPPIHYYGIDFVISALSEATLRLRQLAEEFKKKNWSGMETDLVDSHFVLGDLDAQIPFRDNFFDQICCNLVLSYLEKPNIALKEMWRVLRPGGKMIVTSLKPGADLSEIYRNFISVAETPEELYEGRKLLSNAGMIKIKEVRGLYHFHTEKDLKEAVREAGFFRVRTFRSFGDQANAVVCSKI
jgi:ubiquinone/menaquinone biosynthesis C-methylase UbiE/alpha-beta hydrolase superfamily lysophospholipase